MKAIVYDEYGGPDVLRMEDVEKPEPAKDQVLISIRAVEATKSDCEMRSFKFAVSWFWLPLRIALGLRKPRNPILGNYFAGEKEEELLQLKRMIEAGEIAATVDIIYPMAQAAQAHRRVETEQRIGSVVISVGG